MKVYSSGFQSSLSNAVLHVFGSCSQEEVVRIDAPGVVTGVTYINTIWGR